MYQSLSCGVDNCPLTGWQVFDDVNRNGKRDTGEVEVITDNSGRYPLALDVREARVSPENAEIRRFSQVAVNGGGLR